MPSPSNLSGSTKTIQDTSLISKGYRAVKETFGRFFSFSVKATHPTDKKIEEQHKSSKASGFFLKLRQRSVKKVEEKPIKDVLPKVKKLSIDEVDVNLKDKKTEKGKGGFGAVFEARPKKNILDGSTKDPVVTEKLVLKTQKIGRRESEIEKEISIQGKVGLVPVHDTVQTGNTHQLLMSYKGESLDKFIENSNISRDLKMNIMYQLAVQLKEMHDKKIVHRDIKPQNILIDQQGNISIIDYGGSAYCSDSMQDLPLRGSMGYMPKKINPSVTEDHAEQYKKLKEEHGKKFFYKTDIYSLGAVFLELTCTDHKPGDKYNFYKMYEDRMKLNPDQLKEKISSRLKKSGYSGDMIKLLCDMIIPEDSDISMEKVLSSPVFAKEESALSMRIHSKEDVIRFLQLSKPQLIQRKKLELQQVMEKEVALEEFSKDTNVDRDTLKSVKKEIEKHKKMIKSCDLVLEIKNLQKDAIDSDKLARYIRGDISAKEKELQDPKISRKGKKKLLKEKKLLEKRLENIKEVPDHHRSLMSKKESDLYDKWK